MAFTTTYSLQHVFDISLAGVSAGAGYPTQPTFAELAEGAAYLVHTNSAISVSPTSVDLRIVTPERVSDPGLPIVDGSNPSIAKLANGNLVTAFQVGLNGFFQLSDPFTLDPIGSPISIAGNMTNIEVAALAGGRFVVVYQTEVAGERNSYFVVYNANGTSVTGSVPVTGGSPASFDESDISVAALPDGGFAVAWHRVGSINQIYTAVYESNGSVRVAPKDITHAGLGSAFSPDIDVLPNGQYAVVYAGAHTSPTAINMQYVRIDAATGTLLADTRIFSSPIFQQNPSLTFTPDGFGLVAFGVPIGASSDTAMFLIDPQTGLPLADATVGVSSDSEILPEIASLADGRVVVVHQNETDFTIEGEVNQIVATTVGDGADDVITGILGVNIVDSGAGNDFVRAFGGADVLNGGNGNDTLLGGDNNDILRGGNNNDILRGGNENDILRGQNGNDRLFGDNGVDRLFGGNQNDVMRGGNQGDFLFGENNNDRMFGDGGNDVLTGGRGRDVMNGGAGRDRFDYNNINESRGALRDKINGFQHNDDIDLRTIDANTTIGGNQRFKFIGDDAFSRTAGELHYRKVGAILKVEGDINGDGRADFTIDVAGVGSMTAGDFFL